MCTHSCTAAPDVLSRQLLDITLQNNDNTINVFMGQTFDLLSGRGAPLFWKEGNERITSITRPFHIHSR